MRRIALLLTVASVAAAPATALAQGDPFSPLPPPAPTPTPAPEPADNPGDGDVGRSTLFLVGLGVLAAFFGIGWAITRDARRSLTDSDRTRLEREEAGLAPARGRTAQPQAKKRARQKTKAQRAARRRNR